MTPEDLDLAYTDLCTTMTAIGPDRSPLFLARFALLAMTDGMTLPAATALIRAAAAGMPGTVMTDAAMPDAGMTRAGMPDARMPATAPNAVEA